MGAKEMNHLLPTHVNYRQNKATPFGVDVLFFLRVFCSSRPSSGYVIRAVVNNVRCAAVALSVCFEV